MAKTKKIVKFRHKFYRAIFFPVVFILSKLKGYHIHGHFKIRKGESFIILSNHQTDFDGIFVPMAFNKPLYILATDSIFSKKFIGNFLVHCFGLIAKKKGALDIASNMDMLRVIKEGGSLLFFPEGNRSYAEFQYAMTPGFAKFMRFLKKPIVCYNVHGGTGCYPRWNNSKRKGKFYGEVKRIISVEEISNMSDQELEALILKELKVFDSESKELYKSKAKAENLERMLFICPKCGGIQTLSSKGDHLICHKCGLDVEYTEDLHLISKEASFKFNKLLDWYNYQIRYINEHDFNDDAPIFKDDNIKLFLTSGRNRRPLSKGRIALYKDRLEFENKLVLNIKGISIASPISGRKFNFTLDDKNYLVKGDDTFNALKYVLMFHKLDTLMKELGNDIYYPLEEK